MNTSIDKSILPEIHSVDLKLIMMKNTGKSYRTSDTALGLCVESVCVLDNQLAESLKHP